MRLTAMTDYALRLLMYLGRQPGRLCTIAEVAQAHGLSEAHLMKITHQLGLAGWICTVRGKGGGMTLARPPAEINLGAFVRSVEPDFQLVECLGRGEGEGAGAPAATGCVLTGQCRLAGTFHQALQAFLAVLDGQTLADVLPPGPAALPPGALVLRALPADRTARRAAAPRPRRRAPAAPDRPA